MANPTSHQGSCHCGAVRYRVELDLTAPAITCNCSMCGRTGTYLMFVPAAKFSLEQGEAMLTDYQFNRNIIHHLFCKVCGVKPFARGTSPNGDATVAVNVRTIEGVDAFTIPTQQFDGKSR